MANRNDGHGDATGDTIDAGALPPGARLPVGARLGNRYHVTRFLGEGAMGAVYAARDEVLKKDVALKMVTVAGAIDRLRDEVLLAQRVTHANVCRTYDLEDADGRWYVKMEFVDGETLATRLAREQRLPIDDALAIARQLAAGLAAAHAQGVVHRDLKPQNIQLEAQTGRVVIMDFGIARLSDHAGQTAEGISGTPEYMAPEQARGREVDGRADLYALGCVLYHMLTGSVVFPARTPMAAALRHVEDPPPDPRTARPELPPWLATLVLRLLRKHPGDRPADAAAVIAALTPQTARRRLWPLAAGALVVVAVAAGAVGLARRQSRTVEPTAAPVWRAQVRVLPAYEENSDAPALSPDGTRMAYLSDRERTGRFRVYVEPLDGGPPRAITPPEWDVGGVQWTGDGTALLLRRGRDALRLPLADPARAAVIAQDAVAYPCGERLLLSVATADTCAGCTRLVVRDAGGAETEVHRFAPGVPVSRVRCDPAGAWLVYGIHGSRSTNVHGWGDLWVMPVVAGAAPRQVTSGGDSDAGTFTPGGESIIYSSLRAGHANLWEVSRDGGEPVQLTFGEGPDLVPDVARDGRAVLFNYDQTSVPLFAISIPGGSARKLTTLLEDLASITVTPDGETAVAEAGDHNGDRVVAIALATGEQRTLGAGTSPRLTLDGREVIFVAHGGRLVALPLAGGALRTVAELDGEIVGVLIGGDGAAHASVRRGDGIEVWRVPLTGALPAREAAGLCEVQPAPAGGWQVVRRCGAHAIQVYAPGASLDLAPTAVLDTSHRGFVWDPSGASLIHYDDDDFAFHRYTLATGDDARLVEHQPLFSDFALAPDGQTLYVTRPVSHVRRQLITNFADRPRP